MSRGENPGLMTDRSGRPSTRCATADRMTRVMLFLIPYPEILSVRFDPEKASDLTDDGLKGYYQTAEKEFAEMAKYFGAESGSGEGETPIPDGEKSDLEKIESSNSNSRKQGTVPFN